MQLLNIEKHSSEKNTLGIVLKMDITKELNKTRGMGRQQASEMCSHCQPGATARKQIWLPGSGLQLLDERLLELVPSSLLRRCRSSKRNVAMQQKTQKPISTI